MAVFFDSLGAGGASLQPTISLVPCAYSWKHTARGSQIAVVVAVSWWFYSASLGTTTRTVKYGGTQMPSLGAVQWSTDTGWTELFGLTNVPAGTNTITVSVLGGLPLATKMSRGNSVSYTGVSDFGTFTSGSGSGTSMTVASNAPSASVSVAAFNSKEAGISAYNRNTRYQNNTHVSLALGDVDGTGSSQNFTATRAGTGTWGGAAVVLNAADIVAVGEEISLDAAFAATGRRWPRSPSFVRRSVFRPAPEK